MARDVTSLHISDLSAFAKSLRADLLKRDALPGHAGFLSVIAKAAGYANHQHLKAAKPRKPDPQLAKALRCFDDQGMMAHWPKRTSTQGLCLWVFWERMPDDSDLTEKQVNAILIDGHSFGDHPLLRRSLIDHKLMTRTADGKTYRKLPRDPDELAKAMITQLA